MKISPLSTLIQLGANVTVILLLVFFIGINNANAQSECDTRLGGRMLLNASTQIKEIIERIMTISHDNNQYIICASKGYDNAAAVFDFREGQRYIIYDPVFVHKYASASGDFYWSQVIIFAHEIGHQVLGHVSDNSITSMAEQRQLELQADQFAGRVLAHWGASLANSQALMRSLKIYDHGGISDHPKSKQRVMAATTGWQQACATLGRECNDRAAKISMPQYATTTNHLPKDYTATKNYRHFIQWANKLKGSLVNAKYCQQYATLAVAQAQSSTQHQCDHKANGYGQSKQWNTDIAPQFKWCMGASAYATEREAKFREKKLAECIVSG